jgi:hypothetical protein
VDGKTLEFTNSTRSKTFINNGNFFRISSHVTELDGIEWRNEKNYERQSSRLVLTPGK